MRTTLRGVRPAGSSRVVAQSSAPRRPPGQRRGNGTGSATHVELVAVAAVRADLAGEPVEVGQAGDGVDAGLLPGLGDRVGKSSVNSQVPRRTRPSSSSRSPVVPVTWSTSRLGPVVRRRHHLSPAGEREVPVSGHRHRPRLTPPGRLGDRGPYARRPRHRRPVRRRTHPRQPRRSGHAHRPRSPVHQPGLRRRLPQSRGPAVHERDWQLGGQRLAEDPVRLRRAIVVLMFAQGQTVDPGQRDGFLHAHVRPRFEWEPTDLVRMPVWLYGTASPGGTPAPVGPPGGVRSHQAQQVEGDEVRRPLRSPGYASGPGAARTPAFRPPIRPTRRPVRSRPAAACT